MRIVSMLGTRRVGWRRARSSRALLLLSLTQLAFEEATVYYDSLLTRWRLEKRNAKWNNGTERTLPTTGRLVWRYHVEHRQYSEVQYRWITRLSPIQARILLYRYLTYAVLCDTRAVLPTRY